MGNGATIDVDALQRKYAEERDKRLTRGDRTWTAVKGRFSHFLTDPKARTPLAREPVKEDVDALIIGAGISGICASIRLRQLQINNIRIIERGDDFGGTWYWNRYPGAACDVDSYIYLPLLELSGYVPTEKYASAPEIFDYLCSLARGHDLYEKACLQTHVTSLRWEEHAHRWKVTTDRGDVFMSRFVCLATGSVTQPKLPAVPGIESFEGHSFHTCRWDYRYTGGDSRGGLTGLNDKRIAIVGTGATAVQAIPHLARSAQHLYVFQRTPSAVDVRANQRTNPDWAASLEPGWQLKRMRNFEEILLGNPQDFDLVDDGWTEIGRKISSAHQTARAANSSTEDPHELQQVADYRRMDQIRRRVDEIVSDRRVAAALKPYYNTFCKRPCFHDEYLMTFNRANVTLVDTSGQGVERITPRGIVVAKTEYVVDCIVYSTGFEIAAMPYSAGQFSAHGVGGLALDEKWGRDFKSLHGIHTHGFPNMMVIGGLRDGPRTPNGTYIFDGQCRHMVRTIKRCLNEGITRLEVTQEAEDAWERVKQERLDPTLYKFLRECTPGFINGEGDLERNLLTAFYDGGTLEYFDILDTWSALHFETDMAIERGNADRDSRP